MKVFPVLFYFTSLFCQRINTGEAMKMRISMPNVQPRKDDSYKCTSVKLAEGDSYIVGYEPNAKKGTVHHMLLFGCVEPGSYQKSWNCGEMGAGTCTGFESILFGWARDAPSLKLPKDVGFKVGGETKIKYLVLQIHYAHLLKDGQSDSSGLTVDMTSEKQPHLASIYLLYSYSATILPHKKGIHVDIACDVAEEMHAFAFRTHAHDLGRVITGYRVRNNTWKLLGKGDPHAPQAFYPMKNVVTIKKGDILAARCTYDTFNTHRTKLTHMGATSGDEMCNFYMMFYHDAPNITEESKSCGDQSTFKHLFRYFPKDSDVALASTTSGHHHHTQHTAKELGIEGTNVVTNRELGYNSTDDVMTKDDIRWSTTDTVLLNDMTTTSSVIETTELNVHESDVNTDGSTSTLISEQTTRASPFTVTTTESSTGDTKSHGGDNVIEHGLNRVPSQNNLNEVIDKVSVVDDWPTKTVTAGMLGEVTGLAVDSTGRVLVFHRAGRTWDFDTFHEDNTFRSPKRRGTIQESTIFIIDAKNGKLLKKWGSNMFYLPHGLTVDHEDNVWVTDVGAHQVMKFPRGEFVKPSLTLGKHLIPGSDENHFCKPTDVAVEKSGVVYVADGYCNGRVMKFSPEGELLKQWGKPSLDSALTPRPSTFVIPHSLSLDNKRGLLYVADRENGRIQSFDTRGTFHKQITSEMFGGRVFAVNYNDQDDVLYVVNGPGKAKVNGFTIEPTTGKVLGTWSPHKKGFSSPHAVVSNGLDIYVAEISPNRVWKFHVRDKVDSKESNFARGINNKPDGPSYDDTAGSDNHETKQSNGPALVILTILSVPAVILLLVGLVSKIRGRKTLQKYDMMDETLTNHSRNCCISMNCCRKPYHNMHEELYLMDSDSDIEMFPETVCVDKN